MRKVLSTLVLAASSLIALSASAGYVEMTIGQTAKLPSCLGTVTVNNGGNDDQVNLVFEKVEFCSYMDTSNNKDQRIEQMKKVSRTISTAGENSNGYKTIYVTVHSESNAHSDTIAVKFKVNSPGNAYSRELSKSGTLNGNAVLAYFGGQSSEMFQARMKAICVKIGMNSASTYSVKGAAYTGQSVLEIKDGVWNTRTIKDASQAAVFSSLLCN